MDYPRKWAVAGMWACTAIMAATVLCNAVLGGVFYDTDHLADTLFMLGAAWRSHAGLTPAVEFGHLYGGILEDGLAMTMRLTGPGAFAYDYFTLVLALGLGCAILLAMHRRMSQEGLAALILVTTTLMLTRHPLEYSHSVSKIVSTHSFLYNRLGLAIVMIAGLFVALPGRSPRSEVASGAVTGLLVCLAALTKPTFAILIPAVIGGLLVQKRWHAATAATAGICATILWIDPRLARWHGAMSYSMAQVGAERAARLDYLLLKAVRGPLVQPLATFLAIAAIGSLCFRYIAARTLLGVVLVVVAGIGMTATMGGHIGQVILPITMMVALAAAEIADRDGVAQRSPLRILAFCMVAAFSLPHAANLVATAVDGARKQGQMLVMQGPYARYLSVQEPANATMQASPYEMLADGIAALNDMGDASQWGIVADQGISFEHALLAKPVPGYPLWQRVTAPELAADRPIAPEADIVMLGRGGTAISLRGILAEKIRDDFLPCRVSRHWDIYARRGSGVTGCD